MVATIIGIFAITYITIQHLKLQQKYFELKMDYNEMKQNYKDYREYIYEDLRRYED